MAKLTQSQRDALNAERTIDLKVYQEHGYDSRADYLQALADEHGQDALETLSCVLPPDEDFDGLVSELEDFAAVNGQFGVGA